MLWTAPGEDVSKDFQVRSCAQLDQAQLSAHVQAHPEKHVGDEFAPRDANLEVVVPLL